MRFIGELLQVLTSVSSALLCNAATFVEHAAPSPLIISSDVSSDVINETAWSKELGCLNLCSERDCAAVSVIDSAGVCQLVFLNDESNGTRRSNTSHVTRTVGVEPGAKVWKLWNFQEVLLSRMLLYKFNNSNSGRLGSIQQLSINFTGCYSINAWGAAGGSNSFTGTTGGSGAFMSGRFNLTAGVQLSILVGQAGGAAADNSSGGGGGGGSFVYVNGANRPLVAAGGGGGASMPRSGFPGQSSVNGSDSTGSNSNAGFGGTNGSPGFNKPSDTPPSSDHGGCGAGWLGQAVNARRSANDGDRGGGPNQGWTGGIAGSGNTGDGGFGGGGGSGGSGGGGGAAGAGGGYSGGGAGIGQNHAGGGGGSFCDGVDCTAVTGGNSDSPHGQVVLQLLPSAC